MKLLLALLIGLGFGTGAAALYAKAPTDASITVTEVPYLDGDVASYRLWRILERGPDYAVVCFLRNSAISCTKVR